MQYEWPHMGGDEGQSEFNTGPAPDKPNLLWRTPLSGASGVVSVFNGKAFVMRRTILTALDALTGEEEWTVDLENRPVGGEGRTGAAMKIDDTYLLVPAVGVEVRRISDGAFVSNLTLPDYSRQPGGGDYFPGAYSSELKIEYTVTYSSVTHKGNIVAISVEDPVNPEIAWTYETEETSEILACGDGKLFVGSYQGAVYALDAADGTFLWRAPKTGMAGQHGFYYDGKVYHAATSQFMSCWDAVTGEVLWEFDSGVLGTRSFFAYQGGGAYGRVYDCAIPSDPHGWVVCWDADTGEMLWKQPGYYRIAYNTVAIADGKLYALKCDSAAGSATAGLEMPGYATTCFDAFTGEQLWTIPLSFSLPSIAYGNLYGISSGNVYCISSSDPEPWSFGFQGNIDHSRVALGQAGPEDLSSPRWAYETGGEVSGSPAVVDGKVYIGSHDRNWYCLDAYTGEKIWNFSTGFRVHSSAAVVGGRMFSGADDGNIYCLNAETGEQIWKTSAGGLITSVLFPQEWQPRSSPIVVGSSLYVGSLDGKVYCLSTSDGDVKWTYTTEGPIGGSPAYADGTIYITSTDTYLYALAASNGNLKWKSVPLNFGITPAHNSEYAFNENFCTGTPNVGDGVVFVGAGVTYGGGLGGRPIKLAAFDAETGELVWNTVIGGNSQPVWVPTYFEGIIYGSDGFYASAINATTPDYGPDEVWGGVANRTWAQWIGYQILSSLAYADDLRGPKVYLGSDVCSISCLSAIDGSPISVYRAKANVDSSPAIWNGKMYVGSVDRRVYCFDDAPTLSTSIWAESNKGAEMWNTETIEISGQLLGNPKELTWDGTVYVPVESDLHPGLANAEVKMSLTKPDGTDVSLTTTTDEKGNFAFSYSPTEVGNWGWVVYYDGEMKPSITYDVAYGEWNPISVNSQSGTPSGDGEEPPPAALPMEVVYAVIAVIIIVVVVFLAYFFLKRK
jgi:outer membrane protein assembly factor BamB